MLNTQQTQVKFSRALHAEAVTGYLGLVDVLV